MTIKAALLPHLTELTGAPLTHLEYAQRLSAFDDFDVTFVTPDNGPLAVRAREYGLHVHVLEAPTGGLAGRRGIVEKASHFLDWRSARRRLEKYFHESGANLVFASSVVNTMPATAARHAGLRLVYHLQEPAFSFPDNPRNRRKADVISRSSSFLFTAPGSHTSMFSHIRHVPVNNAVDLSRFDRSRRAEYRHKLLDELGLPASAEIVTCVASISERKGVDTLLAACAALRNKRSMMYTLVIGPDGGDPEFVSKIRSGIPRLQMEDRFLLPGPRNDVAELLIASDLFVLPTRADAQPLSVIEAMAAGLPIVTTTAGDMPAMLRHGEIGSILSEPHQEDLAREIDGVLSTPRIQARYVQGVLDRVSDYTYDAAIRVVAEELRTLATK